ncbi:MAG: iron ABC transporter substrate-binding protein [Spirochaetes bacterium]|nr:iron ABC transporter substrate-binding protein [Spirochaetota bacterium]
MKKKFAKILIFLSFCLIVLAASLQAKADFAVTDMTGRIVSFEKNPGRIISISPGTLRLIIYLEAKGYVVGVEAIEKQNPETRPYWFANNDLGSLPSIGPGGPASINKEPDIEKILAVRPDVIFISYMNRENADKLQKKTGIPVVVLSYGPFGTFTDEVYESLRIAGKILNKEARADAVVNYIENARKDLISRIKSLPASQKPVYIGGIGFKGTHGIVSTETNYAPFDWVRANNIAKSLGKEGHIFTDKEKLLSLDPDIIFIDSGGSGNIRQDYLKNPDFYNALKAFKNRQVFILHSYNWYMTNLGTVIADAYTIGKILYPDSFRDMDPARKSDDVYKFLVGKPVYKNMIKSFGSLGGTPDYIK